MKNKENKQKEVLNDLFGGYFHQDWDFEYKSKADALLDYARVASEEELTLIISLLDRYLAESDEQLLQFLDAIDEYEVHYNRRKHFNLTDKGYIEKYLPEEREFLILIRGTLQEYINKEVGGS